MNECILGTSYVCFCVEVIYTFIRVCYLVSMGFSHIVTAIKFIDPNLVLSSI